MYNIYMYNEKRLCKFDLNTTNLHNKTKLSSESTE